MSTQRNAKRANEIRVGDHIAGMGHVEEVGESHDSKTTYVWVAGREAVIPISSRRVVQDARPGARVTPDIADIVSSPLRLTVTRPSQRPAPVTESLSYQPSLF